MATDTIQVLGIIRWSYPSGTKAFKSSSKDLEQTRAKLYAPERMEHRLFLLEHVVLPCVRAQSDPEFKIAMLMGDHLPQIYKDRVDSLISDVPQIVPVVAEEGQPHDDICRDTINSLREPGHVATAQFRLDDDDAVGIDFVKTTREVFQEVQPMFEKHGLFGLDYCRGFVMKTEGAECSFEPITIRFWAPGMIVFIAPENDNCVLDFHHLKLWVQMPVLMWMDKPMFLRGIHHDNDSNISNYGRRGQWFPINMKRINRLLRLNVSIDAKMIQTKWAEMHGVERVEENA